MRDGFIIIIRNKMIMIISMEVTIINKLNLIPGIGEALPVQRIKYRR